MNKSVVVSHPRESVALLTLNRPEARNALNPGMVESFKSTLRDLKDDNEIRTIVVTGAGKAFCSGADLATLKALREATPEENDRDCDNLKELYRQLATYPKVLVGAVNGPALAGGCGLVSLLDIIVASEKASFGYPEVRIGFVAAMALVFLARQVGERLARELLLTGRTLDAEEAKRLGFVLRVVPSGELLYEAIGTAERVAFNAPGALALTKELLWNTSGMSLEGALKLASRLNVLARRNPEMREGLSAFFAKRKPEW